MAYFFPSHKVEYIKEKPNFEKSIIERYLISKTSTRRNVHMQIGLQLRESSCKPQLAVEYS